MRILVTGGCGFIGSHLVDRLIGEGHSVIVLDKSITGRQPITDAVHLIRGDFGDMNLLKRSLDGVDLVYHLAWTSIPKGSNENPIGDISSNVIGTVQLLEMILQSKVKRVIFNSTGGAIYGPTDAALLSEDAATNPICSYGITKLAVEKYLELFHHTSSLDYVAFRTANAYGPRQDPECGVGFIAAALESVINKQPVHVWGDGTNIRDYIYVDDIVQALIAAANSDFPKGTYHVSSGKALSINEAIAIIGKVTKSQPVIRYTCGRDCDVSKVVLDSTRLRSHGWIPRVSIEKGIYDTWRWMVSEYRRGALGRKQEGFSAGVVR
jgi:UDP-glucose 4-epimerase